MSGIGWETGVLYGPYHRLESPSQDKATAVRQGATGQIWGQAARWSGIPSVKAYRGPLPAGERGIEFLTPVAPDPNPHPTLVRWLNTTAGVSTAANGFVWISAVVLKNTQV